MSAHTPGPWSVGDPTGLVNQLSIKPAIGVVYGAGEEIKANARLIAAAPDMYEALKATLRELTACANQLAALGYAGREGGSVHSAQQEARAALAKAGK